MRALEEPLARERSTLLQNTPLAALAALAVVEAVALVALPAPAVRIIGLAVAHGALLGTALAWTAVSVPRDRWAPLEAALVLGAAAGCAGLHPLGPLAYLAVPAGVAWRRRGWLGRHGPSAAPAEPRPSSPRHPRRHREVSQR